MKHSPWREKSGSELQNTMDGQFIYKFDNGYGASLVWGPYAHGELEMAVLTFGSDGSWDLCYDTPITDDVLGYLSYDEVEPLLDQIAALPRR